MRREGGNPTLGFEAGRGDVTPQRRGPKAARPPKRWGVTHPALATSFYSHPPTFNEKEMHFLHKPEGKHATAKREADGEVPFPEPLRRLPSNKWLNTLK